MLDIYYVIEENTLVVATGRVNRFGFYCEVLRAKRLSLFKNGDVITVNASLKCRVATKKDFAAFRIKYPSSQK